MLAAPRRLRGAIAMLMTSTPALTPPGGTLTTTLIYRGGYAELTVSDTGPSIPEVDLPELCEQFFAIPGQRSRPGRGLAVLTEVVAACGGDTTMDLRPGRTRFLVRPPASVTPRRPCR